MQWKSRNDTFAMNDYLADFLQLSSDVDGWVFLVGVVRWRGPHAPWVDWRAFRRWKTMPNEDRLARARAGALRDTRFFRRCTYCETLCNVGHMHERDICQSCAERHLGVVY